MAEKWYEKDGDDWLAEDLAAARASLSAHWPEVTGRRDLPALEYPPNLLPAVVTELRRLEAGEKFDGGRRQQDFLDYVGVHVRSEIVWADSPAPPDPKAAASDGSSSTGYQPSEREQAIFVWMVEDAAARDRLLTATRRRPGLTAGERLSLVSEFGARNLRYVVRARDPERLLWPFLAKSFYSFVSSRRGEWAEPLVSRDDEPPDIADENAVSPDSFADRQFTDVRAWARKWRRTHAETHGGRLLRTCPECRRFVAFCLYYVDEKSHAEISEELEISVVHSRVIRNQVVQRLKHDLVRHPTHFEASPRGWIVVLNRPAYWPQTVDVSCSPAALGFLSVSTVSIRTGETRTDDPVGVTLIPFDASRPTDLLFDRPCAQGHTAVGEIRINQLRLEATAGRMRARTWIDLFPSRRASGPLSLTVEPLSPCGTIRVGDLHAESKLQIDVPSVSHAVPVRIGILKRPPQPIAVTFAPPRVVGKSKATLIVTQGVRLRVSGGGAALDGALAVLAVKSPRPRFTLTAADPAHLTVPQAVAVPDGAAEVEVDVGTEPVAGEVSVEVVAAGGNHQAAGRIKLLPPEVVEIDLPKRIGSGQSVEGLVKLSERTARDTPISFSIKNTTGLLAPDPVVVPVGKWQCSFLLRSTPSALVAIGTVIATDGRSEAATRIEIVANRIKNLTFVPASVVGGEAATGTIDFEFPVDANADVNVFSTLGVARFASDAEAWDAKPVNRLITVPERGTRVTFTIETARVARDQSVEFVAEWPTGRASGKLLVKRR